MDEARLPAFAGLSGLGLAVAALVLAAATGGPYLTGDSVNGWVIVFAVGLGVTLGAAPFVLERRLRSSIDDEDKRWERAMLFWGAIAAPLLLIGVMLASGGDWSGETLAGAAGLIVTIEAGLVVGAIVVSLLSG